MPSVPNNFQPIPVNNIASLKKMDTNKDGQIQASELKSVLSQIIYIENATEFSKIYKNLSEGSKIKMAIAVENIVGKNIAPFFLNGPINIKMNDKNGGETLSIFAAKFHLLDQPYCLNIKGLENQKFPYDGKKEQISDDTNLSITGDPIYFVLGNTAVLSKVVTTGEGAPTIIINNKKDIALAKEKINFAYKNTKLDDKTNKLLNSLVIHLNEMLINYKDLKDKRN